MSGDPGGRPRAPGAMCGLRSLALAAVVAAAACGTPVPQLSLSLAGPPTQACPSTECSEVPLLCDTVMSIRILDPAEPTAPYLSQCVEVPINGDRDMCSLRTVELDATPIPVRELEVQVAIYPASRIPRDPDTNKLICPANVAYNASTGYPVEQAPTPALGGRAFYHPGDSVVNVTLGCTDLAAINDDPACVRPSLDVAAVVHDFDVPQSVGDLEAEALRVWVGEPRAEAGGFALRLEDERLLQRSTAGGLPSWRATVDLVLDRHACIEVSQDGSLASVHCEPLPDGASVSLTGIRIAKKTLDGVLNALSPPGLPSQGITIGIVVDDALQPVSGVTVAGGRAKISYLESAGVLGGNATSATGIFVALDAPFGTSFSGAGALTTAPAIGGAIRNKVTLVVLSPL